VLLAVEDQGPGVPVASRERVFAPFVREPACDAGNDAATGHGIGLAVVRHIARLHAGTVTVDDAPGGGARFVLTLPATVALVGPPATAPADAYASPAAPRAAAAGAREA
jgi:signal transduction histidine kinase